ncbi:hypothetical protein DFH09DRAFT_948870 [Mycena vulgaris]|nr:hypothetical protein DFH09DRAFT_948870 [Mycena vulgaris]
MPLLVDAYLKWKTDGPINSDEALGAWSIEVIGLNGASHTLIFSLFADRLSEKGLRRFIHTGNAQRTNQTLIQHGYIGSSPEKVARAFPLRLFEIFRQIHRACPRYTFDTLSRTLTNLHDAKQLSTGYDAYLEIIRRVDARVHLALGRDTTWYIKNVCAPCLYKTVNEPPLKYSFLASMDGNSSLKLVDSTFRPGSVRPDNRASTSFRWLTPEQVDLYKNEVADSQKVSWLNINELSGNEAEELAKCVNACVERWKAAGPESRKKMFALFAIAGIFISVCRHGHVLVMCDMIRSGELMKYPLAIVKWLLDHYGADIGLGYDIMCAFFKTLLRSSLGARVVGLRMQGVVPAFHGHAHNRTCQIGWHPLYVEGVGLEDFEECERTFAQSNHLASSTRLATAFHRQQQIDEHFAFHDLDKHASSGNFIYQNYRQALEKISINRAQLSILESELGTTGADYESDHTTEIKYFQDLRSEPAEDEQTADAALAKTDFTQLDQHIINGGYTRPQIANVRTRYRTTWTRYLAVEESVCRFEEIHQIVERWTSDSKEYKDALVMTRERKYRTALAELERLVVQRLFELTKMGMSGLAYKLRDKIEKALRTRSDAIRRAIRAYNDAATSLTPPRERMSFAQVIHMVSLAEFDLLRETRADIRSHSWTQPARREAMVLYFGIKRSKEEIQRLNVEIRRLITFMLDEHVDYYRAIASSIICDPALASLLSNRWRHATRISTSICARLATAAKLVGFSGTLFPGEREGRDPLLNDGIPPPRGLERFFGITQMVVEYEEFELGDDRDVQGSDDEEIVMRELDVDEDRIADLMEHLSTFDDT